MIASSIYTVHPVLTGIESVGLIVLSIALLIGGAVMVYQDTEMPFKDIALYVARIINPTP